MTLSLPESKYIHSQLNKSMANFASSVFSHIFVLLWGPSVLRSSGVNCWCSYLLIDTLCSPLPSLTLNCLNMEHLEVALSCYVHYASSGNIHELLHLSLW